MGLQYCTALSAGEKVFTEKDEREEKKPNRSSGGRDTFRTHWNTARVEGRERGGSNLGTPVGGRSTWWQPHQVSAPRLISRQETVKLPLTPIKQHNKILEYHRGLLRSAICC